MASQASTDGAAQAVTTQAESTPTQSIANMHRYKMQRTFQSQNAQDTPGSNHFSKIKKIRLD